MFMNNNESINESDVVFKLEIKNKINRSEFFLYKKGNGFATALIFYRDF